MKVIKWVLALLFSTVQYSFDGSLNATTTQSITVPAVCYLESEQTVRTALISCYGNQFPFSDYPHAALFICNTLKEHGLNPKEYFFEKESVSCNFAISYSYNRRTDKESCSFCLPVQQLKDLNYILQHPQVSTLYTIARGNTDLCLTPDQYLLFIKFLLGHEAQHAVHCKLQGGIRKMIESVKGEFLSEKRIREQQCDLCASNDPRVLEMGARYFEWLSQNCHFDSDRDPHPSHWARAAYLKRKADQLTQRI